MNIFLHNMMKCAFSEILHLVLITSAMLFLLQMDGLTSNIQIIKIGVASAKILLALLGMIGFKLTAHMQVKKSFN